MKSNGNSRSRERTEIENVRCSEEMNEGRTLILLFVMGIYSTNLIWQKEKLIHYRTLLE